MKYASSTSAQGYKSVRAKAAFIVAACALMTCALFVSGCNDSLWTTGRSGSLENIRPEAVRIIRQGLADDDPRVRANAIEVVASTRQIELMPKVHQLLKDDFVPVRFAAALAVGDTEYHLAEGSVRQLLKEPDENVRIAAAYAAAKLGSAGSLNLIRKAITSSDQTVRANAALLLGKSGDESAIKLLYKALGDKSSNNNVKFMAVEAIARLGDEQILREKLWATVFSYYLDDRIRGITAMGALGTRKARDILITKLDDDVLEVQLAAAEQLGMLGDTIGEPNVLGVFTRNIITAELNEEQLERVNARAALAIGQIGTKSLTRFLAQLLQDKSKIVRLAAAKAVLQCANGKNP